MLGVDDFALRKGQTYSKVDIIKQKPNVIKSLHGNERRLYDACHLVVLPPKISRFHRESPIVTHVSWLQVTDVCFKLGCPVGSGMLS
jgi:hypothetical protein